MPLSALGRAAAERGRAWLEPSASATSIDWSDQLAPGSTSAAVREAAITALHQHLGDHYARRPGIAPLCAAVAQTLAAQGVEVDPNNGVVITGGMQEARFVAVRALSPGHTIWMPRPGPLASFADAARFAGATIEFFDPTGELPAASGDLLVLANPNPATGQVYDGATLLLLAQRVRTSGLTVIADETAAPLVRPDVSFTRFASLPEMAERTLTIGSFAATPGLIAWQVAWFAGPKTLAVKVRDLKQSMTICSPALSQYAALAAGTTEPVVPDNAPIEALTTLLDEHAIAYQQPHTTAFVAADVSVLGGGDVVARACAEQGIHATSGSVFGANNMVQFVAARTVADLDQLATVFGKLQAQQVKA